MTCSTGYCNDGRSVQTAETPAGTGFKLPGNCCELLKILVGLPVQLINLSFINVWR
jgi:hypothetical protein